jgi:phospholipase/carboxylesterase
MIMLHGARGDGDRTLESQRAAAEDHGVVLLCPSTRSGTWDAIRGNFAHDFEKLDELLMQVFERCNIDPTRIASGGFSDGASYALSLGLINGDFFTHIIAHSPGFIISDNRQGKPAVYVSHGRQDEVLPFARCGAAIVEQLEKEDYTPRFDAFDGGHTASPELRSAALAWFTKK